MKILLVEDDLASREMLARRLERRKYTVVQAGDGKNGVELARAQRPDLVLMDLTLPGMDGLEAVRLIRKERLTRHTPVIALTGQALAEDRERALEAGCNDYLPKPVELKELLKKIEALKVHVQRAPDPEVSLGAEEGQVAKIRIGGAAAPKAAQPQPEEKGPGGHILVVDDEPNNRDLLSRRLRRQGYTVSLAEDGAQALELVEAEDFDLILLDIMMPGMNGIQVLKMVRRSMGMHDLPVIMATAKDQSGDVVEALRLGANDYVTKPLDFPVVLARVETSLALRRKHLELQASEARFRLLAENSLDLITRLRADGEIVYASPAARTLLGYLPDDLVGQSLYNLLHEDDVDKVYGRLRQMLDDGGTCTLVHRTLTDDGRHAWIESRFLALPGEDGGASGEMQATSRDITLQMEALETPSASGAGQARRQQAAVRKAVGEGPRTILVVDDDPTMRALLSEHLKGPEIDVITASNAEEAVELAMEHQPDLITIDVIMPDKDGWALLAELRADPDLVEIPVLMLTLMTDKSAGHALGASGYLSKPVEGDALCDMVAALVPRSEDPTVLIVDDNPDTRSQMAEAVKERGWTALAAASAPIALKRLDRQGADCIVVDPMLKGTPYNEFLAALRGDERWVGLPIVVVSTRDLTAREHLQFFGYVEEILQAGPYGRDDVLDRVGSVIADYFRDDDEDEDSDA